ncbi:MAG: helix-turn-helix transcriptional regulator [Flavobacteriales bacterium]|nr:helix-turn-helix transcriptional regulator [Flavobacteriales bacterium]
MCPAVESWRTKKHTRPNLHDPSNLTKREKQVLAMICDGCKTVEIASELNLDARTIERYRSELLFKTGLKNTANLVRYAVEHDLVTFDLRKR